MPSKYKIPEQDRLERPIGGLNRFLGKGNPLAFCGRSLVDSYGKSNRPLVCNSFSSVMVHWRRLVTTVGDERVLLVLGGLNLLGAADQLYLGVTETEPFREIFANVILLGGAGIALLYWGVTLSGTNLHRAVYPRIVGWSLGGAVLLLFLVVFLSLDPEDSIVPSREIAEIAIAVGSIGGYMIGRNEARAITRAREAESHKRELEAREQQLQEQNDRLESFAGMLAHELRNPLTIAQIYHPQEQPGNDNAAEQVQNAIDRIEEMIDVLLVTVRGSEVEIDSEPVAIADIATDAWADLSADVETADLRVTAEQVIRADHVHLEHLLRNLFRNSVEHGTEDVTIQVGDLPDGFYVEDTGPGIPEDIREDVTQAGFTTKGDGIGLGLTFVDQLANTYGWTCTITDSESGGARVEFTDVDLAST